MSRFLNLEEAEPTPGGKRTPIIVSVAHIVRIAPATYEGDKNSDLVMADGRTVLVTTHIAEMARKLEAG